MDVCFIFLNILLPNHTDFWECISVPMESTKKKIENMSEKVHHWKDKVSMTEFSPWKKRLSFERQLMPAVKYPLSSIHLSKKECDHLFDPLLPTLKQIYDTHRTYPTDLLHLPKSYGGHGIPNLYMLQVAKRLKLFFSSIRKQTECGKNLKYCSRLNS